MVVYTDPLGRVPITGYPLKETLSWNRIVPLKEP